MLMRMKIQAARIKVARYVNEDEDIGHQDQGGKVCQ